MTVTIVVLPQNKDFPSLTILKKLYCNSNSFIMCRKISFKILAQTTVQSIHVHLIESKTDQRAKKELSDSPGLVDFAIGLVNSVFNFPNRQVIFFEEFK